MSPEIAEAMELRTLMFQSVYKNPVAKKKRKRQEMLWRSV